MNGLPRAAIHLRNVFDGDSRHEHSNCFVLQIDVAFAYSQANIFYSTVSQVHVSDNFRLSVMWIARANITKQHIQRHWRAVPTVIDKNYTLMYAYVLTL